ncbi:MAG: rod shape-determining protein [Actinobacteria bacterium]|nr:rod shape-determining protein [Actinomycetota bacterium]
MGLGGVLFGRDLAIDLGTTNTRVFLRGRGVVIDEPSVISIDLRTGSLVSAGIAARDAVGRTSPTMTTVRPLRDGVVSDYRATEALLRQFIGDASPGGSLARSRVIVCVAAGSTDVEQRSIEDAAYAAGARRVYLLEKPLAAAIGAGVPIFENQARLIVDIGGGSTEIATLSRGALIASITTPVGGDHFDAAIAEYLDQAHSIQLGERTSERIKISLGSALESDSEPEAEVSGRHSLTGRPHHIKVNAEEIRTAIMPQLARIAESVRAVVDHTPPDLTGELIESGIVLCGGGSQLRGLASYLSADADLTVRPAADPLLSTVNGAGRCLDDIRALDPILLRRPGRKS